MLGPLWYVFCVVVLVVWYRILKHSGIANLNKTAATAIASLNAVSGATSSLRAPLDVDVTSFSCVSDDSAAPSVTKTCVFRNLYFFEGQWQVVRPENAGKGLQKVPQDLRFVGCQRDYIRPSEKLFKVTSSRGEASHNERSSSDNKTEARTRTSEGSRKSSGESDTRGQLESYLARHFLMVESYPGTTLYWGAIHHQNIGHALYDGLYAGYVSLLRSGLLRSTNRAVRTVADLDTHRCERDGMKSSNLYLAFLPVRYEEDIRETLSESNMEKDSINEGITTSRISSTSQGDVHNTVRISKLRRYPETNSAIKLRQYPERTRRRYLVRVLNTTSELNTLYGARKHVQVEILNAQLSPKTTKIPYDWLDHITLRRECPSEEIYKRFFTSSSTKETTNAPPGALVSDLSSAEASVLGAAEDSGFLKWKSLIEFSKENPDVVLHFAEVVMGTGEIGNLLPNRHFAIGGARPPLNGMLHLRDRMYQAYGLSIQEQQSKARSRRDSDYSLSPNSSALNIPHSSPLNVNIFDNKRWSPADRLILKTACASFSGKNVKCDYIHWPNVHRKSHTQRGQANSTQFYKESNFYTELLLVSETDIYVTGPGTGVMLAPFLLNSSVVIQTGALEFDGLNPVPTYMEQMTVGGGTPYLHTLYHSGTKLVEAHYDRQSKNLLTTRANQPAGTPGLAVSGTGFLDFEEIKSLLGKALAFFAQPPSKYPIPTYENLSTEGKLIYDVCPAPHARLPTVVDVTTAQPGTAGGGGIPPESTGSAVELSDADCDSLFSTLRSTGSSCCWLENPVYERGLWRGDNVNPQKWKKVFRKKRDDYGLNASISKNE